MCPHREHPAKTSRKLPVDPGDNLLVESSSENLKKQRQQKVPDPLLVGEAGIHFNP